MLNRENLPFDGWTCLETKAMQEHIEEVLMPAIDNMLSAIYEDVDKASVLKVVKTHLVTCHATDRFLEIGGLMVRCSSRSVLL